MRENPVLRVVRGASPPAPRRNVSVDGEHPMVVVRDVAAQPRPRGHVIALANEKGGVGKSTMAFHCSVALSDAGYRVAAIDLDRRQQTLGRAIANRNGTARRLGVALPSPSYSVLQQPSAAQLAQEIARIGWDCDYVVLDVPGHDCGIARRAIAMADTLVTPVNGSFVDLDLLGRIDPVSLKFKEVGAFAALVAELVEERRRQRLGPLDWLVAPNRTRHGGSGNQQQVAAILARLAKRCGFRLAAGLGERVAYRELFLLGLTQLDLRRIPQFARTHGPTRAEILRLVKDLALPPCRAMGEPLLALA